MTRTESLRIIRNKVMPAVTYSAELRLYSARRTPEEMAKLVGGRLDHAQRRGEPLRRKPEHRFKKNMCGFMSPLSRSASLESHLRHLLKRFAKRTIRFRQLPPDVKVILWLGCFSTSTIFDATTRISPAVMRAAAQLNAEFSLSHYANIDIQSFSLLLSAAEIRRRKRLAGRKRTAR